MNTKGLLIQGLAIGALMFASVGAHARDPGAVYTMTNAPDANRIVVFSRAADGLLTKVDTVSSGGKGSGGGLDALASQGSLLLVDRNNNRPGWRAHRRNKGGKVHGGERLIAVNAGSNDISVFRVRANAIALLDRVGSGGSFPVSVAVSGSALYVLNNGTPANITGFRLDERGRVHTLPHSTRLLGDGAYGQVAVDPHGKFLVVTDKANNRLLVYTLGRHGMPSQKPVITPSSGTVPFGVDFDRKGHLLVVEAGANAVSSYNIAADGRLQVISASVPNGQAATCWIVASQRGQILTTNPGTQSLSTFRVKGGTGQVTLLTGAAGAGNAPLDIDVTENGRFAYAVDPHSAGVDMFRVETDGSLTGLGTVHAGLQEFAQGMAVR